MNQVTLMGNLTDDLELRQSKDGSKHYTQFTLAVHNYKGREKHTDFLDVVAFGQKAEVLAEHVQKGEKLFVIGRLEKNVFTTDEGARRSQTKVILSDFEFVGSKKS
ncbi:MAG: single-stranded DNA-binding protein [Cellulosilyticaceae bacterium]